MPLRQRDSEQVAGVGGYFTLPVPPATVIAKPFAPILLWPDVASFIPKAALLPASQETGTRLSQMWIELPQPTGSSRLAHCLE